MNAAVAFDPARPHRQTAEGETSAARRQPISTRRHRNGWSALEIEINRITELRSRLLLVRPWHCRVGVR